MAAKKRTYSETFIKLGFTSIVHKSVVKPQCVICAKVLSHVSTKPSKLKIHFESCHSDLVGKGVDYFARKAAALKDGRIDSTGQFAGQNEAALEASYRIAYRIAQTKKPHTIGEELIKRCLLEATKLGLGEQQSNKFRQISLSNDTIKSRIWDMSSDILLQVVSNVRTVQCTRCNWTSQQMLLHVPNFWSTFVTSMEKH